jgi:hypothetical protein
MDGGGIKILCWKDCPGGIVKNKPEGCRWEGGRPIRKLWPK